jgi:hypothetical protein
MVGGGGGGCRASSSADVVGKTTMMMDHCAQHQTDVGGLSRLNALSPQLLLPTTTGCGGGIIISSGSQQHWRDGNPPIAPRGVAQDTAWVVQPAVKYFVDPTEKRRTRNKISAKKSRDSRRSELDMLRSHVGVASETIKRLMDTLEFLRHRIYCLTGIHESGCCHDGGAASDESGRFVAVEGGSVVDYRYAPPRAVVVGGGNVAATTTEDDDTTMMAAGLSIIRQAALQLSIPSVMDTSDSSLLIMHDNDNDRLPLLLGGSDDAGDGSNGGASEEGEVLSRSFAHAGISFAACLSSSSSSYRSAVAASACGGNNDNESLLLLPPTSSSFSSSTLAVGPPLLLAGGGGGISDTITCGDARNTNNDVDWSFAVNSSDSTLFLDPGGSQEGGGLLRSLMAESDA